MDLVTCPYCQHVFSPTPGQRVKCPACMKNLGAPVGKQTAKPAAKRSAPTKTAPVRQVVTRTVRESDEDDEASGPALSAGAMAVVIILAFGTVLGLGTWLVFRPRGETEPVSVAAVAKPAPSVPQTPEVFVPDAVAPAPPPVLTEGGADGKDASDPAEPLPKSKTNKVRIIENTNVAETAIEIRPKATKVVVRDVPGVTKAKVEEAIRKGVQYLTTHPGDWFQAGEKPLGHVALGGLALLECKVPASHPVLQQVTANVRALAPSAYQTYEIGVAILYLDRLGAPSDRAMIRELGARLIAGQRSNGGWNYDCPILAPGQTLQLLTLLERSRAPRAVIPAVLADPTKDSSEDSPKTPSAEGEPEVKPLPPKFYPKSRIGSALAAPPPAAPSKTPVAAPIAPLPAGPLIRIEGIPAVANLGRSKQEMVLDFANAPAVDHSNSQFAILGLWAARRHGVAADRSLLLFQIRMERIQMPEGTWGYQQADSNPNPQRPAAFLPLNQVNALPNSMGCVGLLGLALGHAVHQPNAAGLRAAIQNDPAIRAALRFLGASLENPHPVFAEARESQDLYFLWSTERVAVLYDLPTIEDKDWYGYGAQIILRSQRPDGSWANGIFPGSSPGVDTPFALLFLVRSNLVREVTEQLRLQVPLGQSN